MTDNVFGPVFSQVIAQFGPGSLPGLSLWLDAQEGITLESGDVSVWADQSGNGRDATQVTPGNRAEFVSNGLNGLPTVRFDGVLSHIMDVDLSFLANSDMTIYAVLQRGSNKAENYFTGTSPAGVLIALNVGWRLDNTLTYSFFGGDLDLTPVPTFVADTPVIMADRFSAAAGKDIRFLHNRVLFSSSNIQTMSMTATANGVIGGGTQPTFRFEGDISELIYYDRALTSEEALLIENYLTTKWIPPFDPSRITDLVAWYDADDPSTITETAGAVTALADKSTVGNNLTAGAGDEPTTGVNTMNGRNVLNFDGVSDFLESGLFTMTTASTTFMVLKPIAAPASTDGAWSFDGTGEDYQVDSAFNTEFRARVNSTGIGSAAFENPTDLLGSDILVTVKWSTVGGTGVLRINGTQVASDPSYNGTMNAAMVLKIANNRNGDGPLEMNFAEFLHCNAELSDPEIEQVESYLAAKWGI